MRTHQHRTLVALALAGAMGLTACAGDDPATFEQVEGEADGETGADEAVASADPADGATEEESTAVEPAEPQTVELEETRHVSEDEEAFSVTVHDVSVHDYYVEAEVTVVNDSDDELATWYGASNNSPRLYDDRGREFTFQPQAGGEGETLYLQGREGVDAVFVFAGRVDPETSSLTLDLEALGESWSQLTFEVPLGGSR
ncbi:hypothetical protein SGUI_2814 [Serinicoccus hydrothermalis]|uniref:DUF4352 domain-containing protein n=1 Tax=Serinicoccus hydrothermalis TaxID=1758689 RepID=A0A1B1NFL6_9MICO|nr:hypothetical protein [Serinicoccus hydrothermalis]ANS80210.1 hypothetical protein SGUI_2814 [Serinicoccus hydrothermalis]